MSSQNPKAILLDAAQVPIAFLWYALPDAVRCRKLRFKIKLALSGIEIALLVPLLRKEMEAARQVLKELPKDSASDSLGENAESDSKSDLVQIYKPANFRTAPADSLSQSWWNRILQPRMLVAVTLGVSGLTVGSVLIEKAIFKRGEKRRNSGVKAAHTRQAVLGASLTGALLVAVNYLDRAEGLGQSESARQTTESE